MTGHQGRSRQPLPPLVLAYVQELQLRAPMRIRQMAANKASMFCLLVVIGLAGVLDLIVARKMSSTYDEPQSVAYGQQLLHWQADRSDPSFNSKAPVAALNALPRMIAGLL